MIIAPEINPYEEFPPGNPLLLSIAEVPFAVASLRKSIGQRETSIETAQSWLDIVQEIGRDEEGLHDVFLPMSIEDTAIGNRIGAGFATSAFTFTSTTGRWVLKIGSGEAPLPGWFNPSSELYAHWYARNLDILKETHDEYLPHVIPRPQHVIHAKNNTDAATIIIQPFIETTEELSGIFTKSEAVQATILQELEVFYAGAERMRRKHRLIPDLGFNDNLLLAEKEDGHHIVLVDNGLIDYQAVSPFVNAFNTARYHGRLRHTIRKLKKSIAA